MSDDYFAELAETAALRLYTTAAFKGINDPLRDFGRLERKEKHPFPLTVCYIAEAVPKLRAVDAQGTEANAKIYLYRGMKDVDMPERFFKDGGSEVAPMSTTSALEVAVKYSASACSVLLKLETESFRERGADLSFVSAFPAEAEVLYPPLTHLRPTGRMQKVEVEDTLFTIIEVKPSFG